jgi:TPR repeat protein
MEGYRDGGRVLVRKNPVAAARALMRAASVGCESAFASLGYCFDAGLGIRRNSRLAMYWYRRAWRRRWPTAASNIGTIYRDRGLFAQAVSWWKRAIDAGLPEEGVEVGYCYQYGIGVRRSVDAAGRYYRSVIRARDIIEFEREAAIYHLAVLHLDSQPSKRTEAVALLKRASKDGDYPEAAQLLEQLQKRQRPVPCRCRRGRLKNLPGHARCEIHHR